MSGSANYGGMASSARLARASRGLTDDVLTLVPTGPVGAGVPARRRRPAGAAPIRASPSCGWRCRRVLEHRRAASVSPTCSSSSRARCRLPASAGPAGRRARRRPRVADRRAADLGDRRDDGRLHGHRHDRPRADPLHAAPADPDARRDDDRHRARPVPRGVVDLARRPALRVASTCVDSGRAASPPAWSCSTAASSASSCTPRSACDDIGWIAALLGIGVIASLIVRFTLFRPNLDPHAWIGCGDRGTARADRLLALSLAVMAGQRRRTAASRSERLQRQVVRLNECTLMIDAQLAESVPDVGGRRGAAAVRRRSRAVEHRPVRRARSPSGATTKTLLGPARAERRRGAAASNPDTVDRRAAELRQRHRRRRADDRGGAPPRRIGAATAT